MLANMTQRETDEYNREHCRQIANTLDLMGQGRLYECPYCGELVDSEELVEDAAIYEAITNGDECACPSCGHVVEFEYYDVWKWLEGAYDIKYTINSDFSYMAGRVLVAFGGPNIYVDTLSGRVELFWWTDRAEYELTRDACEAIDEALEELYNCR